MIQMLKFNYSFITARTIQNGLCNAYIRKIYVIECDNFGLPILLYR